MLAQASRPMLLRLRVPAGTCWRISTAALVRARFRADRPFIFGPVGAAAKAPAVGNFPCRARARAVQRGSVIRAGVIP
eukprot:6855263-Pyramimonas_sp.AAC.1